MLKIAGGNFSGLFLLVSLNVLMLTGCPGAGDRFEPDEEGRVSLVNGEACFPAPEGDGYKLKLLFINARGAPSKNGWGRIEPAIQTGHGLVCIPPSLYTFARDGVFYIRATFSSGDKARSIVSALEVKNNHIQSIRPNDMERLRPYGEMLDKK